MAGKRTRGTRKAKAPRLLQIEFAPIDSLRHDPKNARTHSESQLGLLEKSLQQFGWYAPIGVRGGLVVFGHGRLDAAKRLRAKGIHVAGTPSPDMAPTADLSHLTEQQIKALALADNRLPELAGWDDDALRKQLSDLAATDFNIADIGFSPDDMAAVSDALDPAAVVETPVSQVHDRFWISVRGPLTQQSLALTALRQAMAKVEGVQVEIGTVTDDG